MTFDLTCPVIIMRHGGLDGVALQQEEYFRLLDTLDLDMHVFSGRLEGDPDDEDDAPHTIVDRLDFHHPDSKTLFASQFTHGPETEGVEPVGREEWIAIFKRHRDAIHDELEKHLASVPHNTPVLVYNLLSLRHAHPAAAAAIRDLILENPHRGFLSHAADPDAERPEKIARIHQWVLPWISSDPPDQPWNGGPYQLNNLYHIVLNPTQRASFVLRYGVPSNHVFEIPDFLWFESKEPHVPEAVPEGFLDELGKVRVVPDGEGYVHHEQLLAPGTVVFISPVRPVYRKRLREAMLVAHTYGKTRGVPVAFLVTHPDIDDPSYFRESVRFADGLGLPYLHTGRTSRMEDLERIYRGTAALPSIGVVASAAGGWENALNEMAKAYLPFFMSTALNSYVPLTETIGIRTFGMSFDFLAGLIAVHPVAELATRQLEIVPGMASLLNWIDTAVDPDQRRALVEHNYRQAYRHLSHRPTALRLMEAILRIYARHGLPGQPGVAVEP